jgi:hypothetical protein
MVGLVVVMLAACGGPLAEAGSGSVAGERNGSDSQAMVPFEGSAETSVGDLSEAEIASLLYMREEEKLARDVYTMLYEYWDLPIFNNIAGSEQAHTDAVLNLLERYDLTDPAAGQAVGEFSDATLQALYDQLVARGSVSLEEALRVGAAIEEIDILDLEEALVNVEHSDIRQVYENLLKGSQNHLRAFAKTLERQTGETYTPQYLSQEAYDAILASDVGRGSGGSRGGGNAGNGRGGKGRGNSSGRGNGH